MTKRTTILFVCLIILAILLILNGTVFVVKDVAVVDYYGQEESLDKPKIAELSKVSGNNIFTISESVAIKNIESVMPEVKVVEVVRQFPSSIKIVVHKRVPILGIKNGDSGFIVVDRECQVLTGVNSLEESDVDLIEVDGVTISKATLGEKLSLKGNSFVRLTQIIDSFERIGEQGYRDANLCLIVEKISFAGDNVSIKMEEGVELRFDASVDCLKKLQVLVSCYNDKPEYRSSGVLTVNYNMETGVYEAKRSN